ncbi:MAG: hypothetical protein JWM56_196 [Candidatus Peribacteria bacterium]|nr:hypothetical protein [Candidatus Peribacteria bacterium]
MAFYNNLEPVSKQLTIVVGLTVVGFMAFGLALSFYRNVLFDETLRKMSSENDQLAQHIQDSYADLHYYQSSLYKDKYAKESLNKLNPGEKILIITKDPEPVIANDSVGLTDQQQAVYDEFLRETPVLEHWNIFLFHKDKLEELKRRL